MAVLGRQNAVAFQSLELWTNIGVIWPKLWTLLTVKMQGAIPDQPRSRLLPKCSYPYWQRLRQQ
jgi:hypothetical protein